MVNCEKLTSLMQCLMLQDYQLHLKEKSSSTSVFKPDQLKNQDSDNKSDKKPKKAPVRTAYLKVQFGCQCNGCFDRISKIVSERFPLSAYETHVKKVHWQPQN